MTNQWHLPTTDCELPVGTKIRSRDASLRELTVPCLFHIKPGETSGVVYRADDTVFYLRDGLPQKASAIPAESILLPEPAPAETVIAVGQVWQNPNGLRVTVLALDHTMLGNTVTCRWSDSLDTVFTLDTFRQAFKLTEAAPPKHGIVVGQFWRDRSDRDSHTALCKIIVATERYIKLQWRGGSTRDYRPESFVKDFELVPGQTVWEPVLLAPHEPSPPPVVAAVVTGDVYAEHQLTEAHRIRSRSRWDRLCEEFGQWLVADAKAHGEEHLPVLSNRALCWIQLEAPGVLKRLEQEQVTADEARRRLDRALALGRPELPHPHEGRSERVYQKRRP